MYLYSNLYHFYHIDKNILTYSHHILGFFIIDLGDYDVFVAFVVKQVSINFFLWWGAKFMNFNKLRFFSNIETHWNYQIYVLSYNVDMRWLWYNLLFITVSRVKEQELFVLLCLNLLPIKHTICKLDSVSHIGVWNYENL